MSAKAYDNKTAAFAGFVIQNIPPGLIDSVMNQWMGDPAALKLLLAGLWSPQGFTFERTSHGHVVFSIKGRSLLGSEEIKRLGDRCGDHVRDCFLSDDYSKHRLEGGKKYTIVLVPGSEIPEDGDRSTKNLLAIGKKCGYRQPPAGIIPYIKYGLSDARMNNLGIQHIAALHEPIKIPHLEEPLVLGVSQTGWGSPVFAQPVGPRLRWRGETFAFVLPD